jgi:superfamily II DNA or RNA helicase
LADATDRIVVGAAVRLRLNPNEIGLVRQIRADGYARVQFGATASWRPIDQLELIPDDDDDLLERLGAGRFGAPDELRRTLSHIQLSGQLSDTIYSMEATNTEFHAHQFKPVLKLLASPSAGLLIADEVGLGKTIEAGLIWTELRARYDARRLLVLCPKTLCRKWRDELSDKFDVRAEIMDAAGVAELLSNGDPRRRSFAVICGLQGARPPQGWDDPDLSIDTGAARLARRLRDLAEEAPIFDLLVVDEAHHLRNTDTQTHQLGRLTQPLAEHRVFLSATPIHLRNRDLFALLRLLDPDNFADETQFQHLVAANRPLVEARNLLTSPGTTVASVMDALHRAADEPLLAKSQQLAALRQEVARLGDPLPPERRAEYAHRLEQVSLLSNLVTRTRRRDVQELRVIREPQPELIAMTLVEREVYDTVTAIVSGHANRVGMSERFLLATPQRLLASCIPAAVAHWRDGILDSEDEDDEEEQAADTRPLVGQIAAACRRLPPTAVLEAHDGKFNRFLEVVRQYYATSPGEKLLVFSSFRPTLRYLARRLAAEGFDCAVLHGAIAERREDVIQRFTDPAGPRLLLSSEIGGEGIDLQFCRAMVNYDMPWNPMRVEQRIGRIDRLGQKAEQILIWNLVHKDTIDERIYERLYARLDLCRQALGDYEDMLGSYARELTSELLRGNLSQEALEARFQQTEQALAERARTTADLERDAAALIAHGDFILQTIHAAHEMHRWIAPEDIVVFVADALGQLYSGCAAQMRDGNRCELRLSAAARDAYRQWATDNNVSDAGRLLRDDPPVTLSVGAPSARQGGRRREETLNQTHPFLRFLTQSASARGITLARPVVAARIDAARLTRELPPGVYVVQVQAWEFRGAVNESTLAFAGLGATGGAMMDDGTAELLCRDIAISGAFWPEAGTSSWLTQAREMADHLTAELQDRFHRHVEARRLVLKDRATMQRQAVHTHWSTQRTMLIDQREAHFRKGRASLVAATDGRLAKLKHRCEERLERIRRQEELSPSFVEVAVLLVEIVG